MITKSPGICWDVSCDSCAGGELTVELLDAPKFQDCVDEIKQDGWTVRRGLHGWEHSCPDCTQGASAQSDFKGVA